MSALRSRQPTVILDSSAKTHAALVERGGELFLIMQPFQTFSNAVQQISKLLPSMHPDEVRRLVRLHMPTAADFDSVESSLRNEPSRSAPHLILPPPSRQERRRSWVRRVAVQTVIASLVALCLAAYFVVASIEPEPFESEAFESFAQVGSMLCDPLDSSHARCTDVDGMVMLATVVTSPEYTVFSFAYGAEKLALRVYPTVDCAETAAREPANREMYANLSHVGRYLLYGTDEKRLKLYANLMRLGTSGPAASPVDLPIRLSALTFGALNLPRDNPARVSATQESAVLALLGKEGKPDASRLVAAPATVVSQPRQSVATPPRRAGAVRGVIRPRPVPVGSPSVSPPTPSATRAVQVPVVTPQPTQTVPAPSSSEPAPTLPASPPPPQATAQPEPSTTTPPATPEPAPTPGADSEPAPAL